jgi:hypothetical protein
VADDSILDEIVREVQQDGVYVAPAFRQHVDAAEEAAIEAAVARIDTPVNVIAVPLRDDDMFAGSAEDLLTRVHDKVGGDGWYVAPAYLFDDGDYSLATEQWASSYDAGLDLPYDALGIAEELHPTDLGAGLVELTTAIADGNVAEKVTEANQVRDARRADEGLPPISSTGSDPAGDGDSDAGWIVSGIVLLVLVVLVVALVRAWRRAGGLRQAVTPPARRHYALPASVLDRVREADTERIAARADRETLALGERIEATEIGSGADTAAWQSALDHYDAARRVGSTGDLLDAVGAVVLVERGEAALDAALAGRPFTPSTPCYLNPLHGTATARRSVDHGARRLDVPLCKACRQDLAAGRAPDILDVMRDGEPVHYFDADAEPWSSSGYGALQTDLVERIHRLG